MDSSWTKHIKDPEDRERFIKNVKASVSVLDQLSQIILDKRESADKPFSEDDYNKGSFACRAADINGYKRALDEILRLTYLDHLED